jgi:ribonuclease P protein component
VKIKHILKATEFADILKTGDKIRGKVICLHLLRAPDEGIAYVGVVIPKKYVPKAVERNYLKRVIYAYFRSMRGDGIRKVKAVVRVTAGIKQRGKKTTSKEIRAEIESLLRKGGVEE